MTPLAYLYADVSKNSAVYAHKTPALVIATSAGVTFCAAGVTACTSG